MREYAVDLLRQLVEIPSVNPCFSSAPWDCLGEERVAAFLLKWAKENRIEARRYEASPGRPCVLLSAGPVDATSLLVSAHMDTVWTRMESPFSLQCRDGYQYGLGTVDDKGPLVSALCALRNLSKRDIPLRFHVLASCDEEWGLAGIRHMIPERVRPDGVIIAEATGLRIVTAHKGSSRYTFQTVGERVHSSLVPEGDNAIYKAARLIGALEEYARELLLRPPHSLLGTSTLCVGVVRGGEHANSVPDLCELQVNYRSLPGDTSETILAGLCGALDRAGTDYLVAESRWDADALETPSTASLVERLKKILTQCDLNPSPCGVPYATEAFVPAKFGIPTVVFGPGSIEAAHSPWERIETDQILLAAEILIRLVESGG